MDCTISVIIPVYNTAKFLPRCIDSVLKQTYSNIEIICIDDGSSDDSLKILETYAAKDERVKVHTQSNAGVSSARNNGFKHSCGEYVYFMDSDDYIHPQLLEICLHYTRKYNAQIVGFCFCRTADDDWMQMRYKPDEIPHYVSDNPLSWDLQRSIPRWGGEACIKFYRREILNGVEFTPGISNAEDVLHTWQTLMRCPTVVKLDRALYVYEDRCGSATRARNVSVKFIEDHFFVIRELYKLCSKHSTDKLSILCQSTIPSFLNTQYKEISKVKDIHTRRELYTALAREIRYLRKQGLFRLMGFPSPTRYFKYLLLSYRYIN